MPPEALLSRAIAYLDEHGSASPAELARHVFGGEGFAPLLASLSDERLRFDGALWQLRPPGDELAILEILATGPKPGRHCVVEVAAKRGGAHFHTLIASDKPVPKLLRKLGVPKAVPLPLQWERLGEGACRATDDWLTLEQTRQALRSFIGQATAAGFGYQPEFLDQVLGPRWPAVDLLRLARSAGYTGRPAPPAVAKHFGLTPPLSCRPLAMLMFSAALLEQLRGERSLDELRRLGRPQALELPICPQLPSAPGVYSMLDSAGQPLYVGKSVNLKRRVGSYLGTPIALSRNMHDLVQLTARIEVLPVSSELEALLLEDHLIREWLPPFNLQRGGRKPRRYLRLSMDEPFPRLTVCAEPAAGGAIYFGPFRHATAVARLRAVLGEVLRLRTCTRQLPPRRKPRPPCAKASRGQCLAPCVPGPPPAPYDAEVELTKQLLTAPPDEFRRLLRRLLRQRPPPPGPAAKLKRQLRGLG